MYKYNTNRACVFKVDMFKRTLSLMIAFAVLLCGLQFGMVQVTAAVAYFAGSGTEQDPYQIGSKDDFDKLSELVLSFQERAKYNNPNVHYKLTKDLDLNPGYTFEYQDDSNRVKVSNNGAVVCYIGMGKNTGKYYADPITNTEMKVTSSDETVIINNNTLNLWTPIGTVKNPFAAKFDGGKHTISGMFINQNSSSNADAGLFDSIKGTDDNNMASITNINMDNGYVGISGGTNYLYAGGIAGSVKNGEISNSSNSGVIVSSGFSGVSKYGSYIGGITGYISNGIISNSSNNGVVSSNIFGIYSGGIAGYMKNVTINSSSNSGAIISSSSYRLYSGGIVGYLDEGKINNSSNSGAVISSNSGEDTAYAGGIAGYMRYGTISKNKNSGEVSSSNKGDYSYAGGIAGCTDSVTINGSINSGAISSSDNNSTSSSNAYAGGIIGYAAKGTISDSYNKGIISSSGSSSSSNNSNAYAGGITGEMNNGTVRNSGNSGEVSTDDNTRYRSSAGGISGYVINGTISSSNNSGKINSNSTRYNSYAGGIGGRVDNTTINNNSNNGVIISSSGGNYDAFAGGITGHANNGIISNSSNSGAISSSGMGTYGTYYSYAGGITGYLDEHDGGRSKVEYCYSVAGNVNQSVGEHAGGVISWFKSGTVIKSYYDKTVNTLVVKAIGNGAKDSEETAIGKTTSEMQGISLKTVEGWTDENWKFIENNYPITKLDPLYEMPSGLTATYGQKLGEIENQFVPFNVGGTWAWSTPISSFGNVGENEFTAIFTPNDDRYKTVQISLTVTVDVDKSGWGKEVTNNGVKNYVSAEGTTSAEVTGKKQIWLKEESGGTSAWYCLDNSSGAFRQGSRFSVRWLNKDTDKNDWDKYYDMLDEDHKDAVDSGRLWIFLTEVTDPDGVRYTDFNTKVPFYVQIGKDWDEDDIKAAFISSGTDEVLESSYVQDFKFPAGKGEFAKLMLEHFSPYAVYDEMTNLVGNIGGGNIGTGNTSNDDSLNSDSSSSQNSSSNSSSMVQTGDQIFYIVICGLVVLLVVSSVLVVVFKKKKEDK